MTTLVLFDIDGTLVNTHGCGRVATERAMQEVFGMSGALAAHVFRGKTDWQTLHELLLPLGMESSAIVAAMPDFSAAAGRHFAALAPGYPIAACAGGLALVAALRARADVLCGIVTGNVETVAPLKLGAAGYDLAAFVVGAYGSEAHDRYALPPLALARAQGLHGGTFERTVIIGDTPDDVACSRSITARCIAVASGTFSRAELAVCEPDIVLDSLADLDESLAAIFGA